MDNYLQNMRHDRYDFERGKLDSTNFGNPFDFFKDWYKTAHDKGLRDPHAMVLSTADKASQPANRIVYLRELVDEGLIFYTNYKSRKGEEIADNPKASALFYWADVERQVRVEGSVEKVDSQKSDDYFAGRPRESQLGAWASNQSSEIPNRKALEDRLKDFDQKFAADVPRPPHWGGFFLRVCYFEFWQGRPSRLHDRICYEKSELGWRKFRIAP